MQHTLADLEFAANTPGMDRRAVREHLRDTDADGLGWVQLVALAGSLAVSAIQKKRAKKKAKKAEAAMKAEEERERIEAERQAQEVQRAQALQAQQRAAALQAASMRAKVAPPLPIRRAVPTSAGGQAVGSRRSFPIVPVALAAGGTLVALALILRRKR